jgi:hypothetical protein
MSPLDRLERIFGRFSLPNLTLFIVIGQVFVQLARMLQVIDGGRLFYAPVLVLEGEWWRLFTFMLLVPTPSFFGSVSLGYMMMVFGWYLFYLMGSALEGYWGVFRFNVFLLLSYGLTIAVAWVTPDQPVSNLFILTSVFLAFAYLNPDFELLLFLILPVKIKWLALLTWILYVRDLAFGDTSLRLQIAAPIVTFLLFFGGDLLRSLRQGQRVRARKAERIAEEGVPRHVCHVCGKTDLTNPELDFRYCSKCAGDQCYCPEHIHHHEHVVAPENETAP